MDGHTDGRDTLIETSHIGETLPLTPREPSTNLDMAQIEEGCKTCVYSSLLDHDMEHYMWPLAGDI